MSIRPCLFVSAFLPSPNVPSGGQKLTYEILREKARDEPVSLLAFCNEHESAYLRIEDYKCCVSAQIFALTPVLRLKAAATYPFLPLTASTRLLAAKEWLKGKSFASIWVEFVQAAELLRVVPRELPSTLVVHDLFHQNLERRARSSFGVRRWLWELEALRTRRWETELIRGADHVATLNEKDRALIQHLSGRNDVAVRYPKVEESFYNLERTSKKIKPHTILFWGQMSRVENEDAMVWFCAEILPLIRAKLRSVKLLIAGANPTAKVRALSSPMVEVLGFVREPVPLFESVALAVAPLRQGAGIKIKVVEYIAARIPTVATAVGAEGVQSSPLLKVCDAPVAFATACLRILTSGEQDQSEGKILQAFTKSSDLATP